MKDLESYPTPETDAHVESLRKTPDCFCEAEFARRLERERNEAIKWLKALDSDLKDAQVSLTEEKQRVRILTQKTADASEEHDKAIAMWRAACDHTKNERNEAREELAETRKDYQCLASQLDGHDATECAENLKELKRRFAACCETLAEVELYIPLPERLLNRVRETLAATATPFPSSGSGGDQVPVIATSK